MLISFPGVAESDLGLGYDFFEANLTAGTPFDPATIPPLPPPASSSGQNTAFFAQLVEDSASLRKVLDISAQAEFGFGAFSGNMSAGFTSELDVNSYSLFIVGKITVELEKRGFTALELSKLRIANEILEWFKGPDDLGEFRNRYGDYFSTGLVQGGVLFFVVEIEANSRQDKSEAMLSVSGSGMSWKASGSFKQAIDTLQKGRRITAQVAQSGGDWSFKEVDADSLFNMAVNFPNTVASSPVTLALEVGQYDSVQNWPGSITNYTPLLQLNESVLQFQAWHSAFLDTLSDIDFIRENLIAFAEADDKKLADLRSQVKKTDGELREGLVKLAGDPLKNQNLVPSLIVADPETFRTQLPRWRENLPRSAKDLLAEDPNLPDGDYDIWLQGDGLKRIKLFCRMGANPGEYLRLVNPNSSMTRSDTVGGDYPGFNGTDVVTTWHYIRLDSETLEVDLKDFDGSESTGRITNNNITQTPFGSASQCGGHDFAAAYAIVDIGGTPFVFHPSVSFGIVAAYNDEGTLMEPPTKTRAYYAAKGRCSGWGPSVGGVNRLVLEYVGQS